MGIFKKWVIGMALGMLRKALRSRTIRRRIIERLNNAVDIPKLNEKQEEKLFNEIYNALADALGAIV